MEGNGEGMVAVVQGLRDAGLAVTLMSRRCANQGRKVARVLSVKNHCLPQTKSSVETNTYISYDRMKSHAGIQICDDRYASSYQLAHCGVNPTSPPIGLSEFPPQRTLPNRTQGNFEIGGIRSGELSPGPIRTQNSFRSSLRWANRRSVQFSRASCQTDPFVHSLRRYPTFLPSRSISADIIERLIKHTQAKNFTKPSKISKSVRSIPKDKTDEHANRQEHRQSKNIQTYTRTKNESQNRQNEKDRFVRKERSCRMSFSSDRRHKNNRDGPINTTYDYLRGSSSLYRRRHERVTDVRYLDNLAKYIKDTLQQICDDKPVLCPKIQSRYNQHRRSFHPEQTSLRPDEADDQAAPSGSRAVPSTTVRSIPGTCNKNCPKGRKICNYCRKPLACLCIKTPQTEAATSSPSVPTASKFCQCLPEYAEPENSRSLDGEGTVCLCVPRAKGYDQNESESYNAGGSERYYQKESVGSEVYDQKVDNEVTAWINELPVKVGDTPQNVVTRQKIGGELADVLKNISQDDNFDDNAMNEVKKCLNILPIWLPDNKAAQDVFKDLMARNLLDKLKKIPITSKPDKFADTIKKWVDEINFKKDVDNNKVADDFIDKLKPIALNRPTNHYYYANKLKEAIKDKLDGLPVNTKGDKEKTQNELADKLIDKLMSLPELSEKSDNIADTIKQWVNEISFKKAINKNKVADDFINTLKPIALSRPDNNYEYARKLRDEIKDMLEEVPVDTKGDKEKTINWLAEKLIDKLVSLPKDAVKPEDMVNSVDKTVNMVNDWLDEEGMLINFPFLKNSEAVEDLIKKLHELQANGVGENVMEEMKNVVLDFLKHVLGITDPQILEKMTNQLLSKLIGDTIKISIIPRDTAKTSITPENREAEIEKLYQDIYNWMKNLPETSHLDPEKIKELSRELANAIYDSKSFGGDDVDMYQWLKRKLSDVGEGQSAQEERRKRKLVLNEVGHFLADAITELPSEIKEELKDKLADMLIKNLNEIVNYEVEDDLLEDETDRLINKLLERIRNIYAPDKPVIKVKIPKVTKKTLQEEMDELLDNTSINIKNKDDLKTNLMNTLVDGVLKGEDENGIKEEVYDQLRAANIPDDEVKDIAQKLLDATKEMALALKSQDSTMTYRIRLSKAEPSRFKESLDYQQKDVFVPKDVLKLDKKRKGSSLPAVEAGMKLRIPKNMNVLKERRSTETDGVDLGGRRTSTKPNDKPLSDELAEQMKMYNIDPNDTEAVARFQDALQEAKQGKGPLDRLMSSLQRYSNLPKVPRKDKSKPSSSAEYLPSPTPSYTPSVRTELIAPSIETKDPSLSSGEAKKLKSKTPIKSEPDEGITQLSSEQRQTLNKFDGLEKDKNRDYKNKESSELYSDGKAGSTGSYMKQQQVSPKISGSSYFEEAKRDKLGTKIKQKYNKPLENAIQEVLDKTKTRIDDREDLERKLKALLNQLVVGNVDDVTDDVYTLLRNAKMSGEEARDATNQLLSRAKNLSEVEAQKFKAVPLKGRSLDYKIEQKIKQSLKHEINDVLDNVNAEIENRADLETKLNTLLNELVVEEVGDIKDDVYEVLRRAEIPGEEARDVTNILLGKAKDLSESVAQKIKSGPSKNPFLGIKNKEEFIQPLKGDIHNALDRVKTKIYNREDLESNLLNTILDRVEEGDLEDTRDDLYKLLRDAQILGDEARNIANKVIGKAQDLYEGLARKMKSETSKSKPFDSKIKQEVKQALKTDIKKALDKVTTKIDGRDNLEANLLNTLLNQAETGGFEDIRDDVNKLFLNANIPQGQAKEITNKLLGKGKELSEALTSKRQPLESKTKQEIESLKTDIEKALDRVKSKIDDREYLEANLLNTILYQAEGRNVEDVQNDVYRQLRSANIPQEQAKDIINKLLGKGKDSLTVAKVAQKAMAGPSQSKPLDSPTKQEIKKNVKADIQKALDKVKFKIDDRDNLEANLFNTIFNQEEMGDLENVRDDVYRQLRNANIPLEQARDITNKLLDKAKDPSESISPKTGPVKRKPLDSKTKRETKQSIKANRQKALDQDKTKNDNKENFDANSLDTALSQVEGSDDEDDAKNLLRNTTISREEAKGKSNKLSYKAMDLSDVDAQRTNSRSRSDEDTFEDAPKSGKADGQRPRPDDLSAYTYSKKGRISKKGKEALKDSIIEDVSDVIEGAPLPLSSRTKNVLKAKLSSALIKGLSPPYTKDDIKSKVLGILSEESIKLQGDKRPKATPTDKVCQKEPRRRDSSGRTKISNESVLKEITDALDDLPTKIPKSKKNNLKKKLADIVMNNIRFGINEIRMKIFDILSNETHLHRGVISDLTNEIVERIIDIIKESEIADRRKTKKMIYSLQIKDKKRSKLFGGTNHYDKRTGKRRNDGNASSDEDTPASKARTTMKHDYSNLNQSISDHIDYTIDKEHINIPRNKISLIKQKLEQLAPKDILAVIRGDKSVKNEVLDMLINEININNNDANELMNGVIKRFNESDDSQYSATSSQMQDMKGYLKGEILGLLEKYNVKFTPEASKSGSTSPSLQDKAPLSSTPRDDVGSPQMMNELSLSTVGDGDDDDEVSETTIKTSDRINSEEYFNRVTDAVDGWAEELPVELNDDSYRKAMVKDLAGDIIERQKYLQLNPDAKTSANEEMECLKYQVFRWLNNIVDIGDLTPVTPNIRDLRDRIKQIDVPLFNKSSKRHREKSGTAHSNGKTKTSDAFLDKFEEWADSLPTKFKNEKEKEQYENLKYELFIRLKELGPQARPQAIQNEINRFIRNAPLDPTKRIDLDDKILELTGIVQTTEPSKMEATSFESKTGYKKLPNLLYDFIENWCDTLPFDESLDQDTIKNMKHSLANKILQRICQLNLNPEILNDDFLYEDVLRDELDNLLSDIRNYLPLDDEQLAELKDILVNKIKEAKQKTQNELAGQMYKQQLRDAISRTLPPGLDLTSEDQTSLEVLKDAVADAFINLNYASGNEELANKLKKKIADAVTRFCNNYLQRHPATPLCSNKLNQDLYAALKNVSLPNDESMRSEVEHVRMKELITDWVKGLPLAEQTPTGQSTLNKMISVLAKRLQDLENAGELNDEDYTEDMKREIKKWLAKLPLLGGKDAIDHYAGDLIEILKNTEDARKFDSSTRIPLDETEICPGPCHYGLKERPKPKPCPDTCMFTPQFPSSLTREDREHLDRIRERVQQARSKLAKRPCREVSPSPCADTGSQTGIRPYGSIKSIPSVCPGPMQRPYKSAAGRVRESPSCRIPCETPRSQKSPCPEMFTPPAQARHGRHRMDGVSPCVDSFSPCDGSYSEMQPQIIVKEYYWDSTGNSNHQIPSRTPCDTYPSSREPRSCSHQSPPCRGKSSQPHTVPQSPQISSSDQENRRPRAEPGTSRYYKEKVTRLGSLDDMRGPNMKENPSENFEWSSVRFPEDDDFWGPAPRPMIVSDDDYPPFSRERERKEERVRCRCRERVLTKCATKRRNKYGGSCSSCNNDSSRRCAKCNPVQCPHPSYLYFRK